MALSLFENGWSSYGMDWENPDPYNPIYIQALAYAIAERASVVNINYSVYVPVSRTPLNYAAFTNLYEGLLRLSGRFVYKPGTEPDGKQVQYMPDQRFDTEYDLYSYIPLYVFSPISVEHISSEYSDNTAILYLPTADASADVWKQWLKDAKQFVCSCCCVAVIGGDLSGAYDQYAEERPKYRLADLFPYVKCVEAEGIINSPEEEYTSRVFGSLYYIQSTAFFNEDNNSAEFSIAGSHYPTGNIQQRPVEVDGDSTVPEHFISSTAYTTHVLTGLPVGVGYLDDLKRRSKYDVSYCMEYDSFGYPFVQDQWIAFNSMLPTGVDGDTTTGGVYAEQERFDIPIPDTPTEDNPYTWKNAGFCVLGMYHDFSEGFKFK